MNDFIQLLLQCLPFGVLAFIFARADGRLSKRIESLFEYVLKLDKPKPIGREVTVTPRGFVRIGTGALLDVKYPEGHEQNTNPLEDAVLNAISDYTVPNTLMVLVNNESEFKKEIRRRYMTALAALYEFEIPASMAQIDAGARQVYERILRTMQAHNVLIETNFDNMDFTGREMEKEYYMLSKPENHEKHIAGRTRLYMRHYVPLERFVIQTLLQQSSGMIYPFWPAFEKKLRKNLGSQFVFVTTDVLKSVVTAVGYKHNLCLPDSYLRQAPLTALLVSVTLPYQTEHDLKLFKREEHGQ